MKKPRILVVEDESAIADTILYVLANDGFIADWCATAEAAIAAFTRERPALAILDVGLPDCNGFELFRELQVLPGGSDVPPLFLTARSDEIDRVVGKRVARRWAAARGCLEPARNPALRRVLAAASAPVHRPS